MLTKSVSLSFSPSDKLVSLELVSFVWFWFFSVILLEPPVTEQTHLRKANQHQLRRECSNALNVAAHVQIHKLNRKSHNLSNIQSELMTTMNECDCAQNPGRAYCNDGRKTIHIHKPMLWHFINWLVCIVDVQCSGSAVVFLNAIRFNRPPAEQSLFSYDKPLLFWSLLLHEYCETTEKKVDWIYSIQSYRCHWFGQKHYVRLQKTKQNDYWWPFSIVLGCIFLLFFSALVRKSICWLHFFILSFVSFFLCRSASQFDFVSGYCGKYGWIPFLMSHWFRCRLNCVHNENPFQIYQHYLMYSSFRCWFRLEMEHNAKHTIENS